jgi:hypothetical protein
MKEGAPVFYVPRSPMHCDERQLHVMKRQIKPFRVVGVVKVRIEGFVQAGKGHAGVCVFLRRMGFMQVDYKHPP